MMPVIVCVFPVPGYNRHFSFVTYRSLDKADVVLAKLADLVEDDQLRGIEKLSVAVQETQKPSLWPAHFGLTPTK